MRESAVKRGRDRLIERVSGRSSSSRSSLEVDHPLDKSCEGKTDARGRCWREGGLGFRFGVFRVGGLDLHSSIESIRSNLGAR